MGLRRTEERHPLSAGLHALAGAEVLARVHQVQTAAMAAVQPAIPMIVDAAEAGARSLLAGGRMGYAGAGSSGLMALADCLELPGTFGVAPDRVPMMFAGGVAALAHMQGGVEDDPALALGDLDRSGLAAGDTVLCLAASGGTPYTLTIAAEARKRGSAQKLALNMLSVLVGIRLGHVHDGFMVNLTADNQKLRDRAARIVSALSGATPAEANDALSRSAGRVKPAVLIARGLSPEEADKALTQTGGHLAPILSASDTNQTKTQPSGRIP
jgi:N-acetylmuramic acid 6-phosphate etherase